MRAALGATIRRFARSDDGATAIEYGLIAALVFMAIVGAVESLGTNLGTYFDAISNKVDEVVKN